MPEKKLILSKEDITRRVQELGATLTKEYADSNLLVIGVLNGAFIFMADLVREIKLDLQVDFVRVASYGMSTKSCGEIRFSKDVELDIRNRDILLVEDIVDTGQTLAALYNYLKERGAKSVRTCALIDKKDGARSRYPSNTSVLKSRKVSWSATALTAASSFGSMGKFFT
jgi:hypoxanthine phosphoribosyltransferase